MVKGIVTALTIAILAVVAPLWAAHGQPAQRVPRIGVLFVNARQPLIPFIRALEDGFRELGYLPGRNLSIDYRFAEGQPERLPSLARELASLNVDVFVVPFTTTAKVVLQVTANTPIVVPFAMNPVEAGLAKSLSRPGGFITGLTVNTGAEIFGKNLELLREVLAKGSPVGLLLNPASQIYVGGDVTATEDAGRKLGLRIVRVEVRTVSDFERAFSRMTQEHVRGLVVLDEPVFYANRRRVNDLALQSGVATSWPGRYGPETGALMSYGVEHRDLYRRAAGLVDKILKGTKAGDIPIEQPTKLELAINIKTAKTLGLTIPPSLLLRADHIIE